MPLYKLHTTVPDLIAGRRLETMLGELSTPPALAVTLFESKPAGFVLEAYYETAPVTDDLASAIHALGADIGAPRIEEVPEENWVALSQAALPPIAAGRFLVHGSHDRARVGWRRGAIEIEAGVAFGTGHNATTALCLELLDQLSRRRRLHRVLDMGCGTAVLGIAAARAEPRARVLAADNDPVAVAVARDNVQLNRVAARVAVRTVDGFAHPAVRASAPFDLVLANILPGALIATVHAMRQSLRPGGVAVLSGILNHQVREMRGVYTAAGFRVLAVRSRDGWTALALERP